MNGSEGNVFRKTDQDVITYNFVKYKTRLLAFFLVYNGFTTFFRYISFILFGRATYATYSFLGLSLILLFFLFYRFPREKIGIQMLKALFVVAGIYIFNYFIFSNTRQYYNEYSDNLIEVVILGIPTMVLISEFDNPILLLKELRPMLRILSALLPIIYLLGADTVYSPMEWGNRCYRIALLYFLCFKVDKESNKPFEGLLLVIIIAFSTLGGRQSLVFMIVGMVLITIIKPQKTPKDVFIIFTMIIIAVFVILFYQSILELLKYIISEFNINSRSLSKLADESLFDTSNRESIYLYSRQIISVNRFSINGLFADRLFLRQYRHGIAYAHNFVYELLIDYGLLVGSTIIAFLIIGIIRAFFRCKKENKAFFITIFIISFAKLIVSSSIVIEPGTLVCIGLMVNKRIKNPIKRKFLCFR